MPDIPEWVLIVVMCTIAYYYQRSRWGLRIMTRETMRAQMQKEINDVLWNRWTEGKLKLKEYIRLSNILADIFDFPDLRSHRFGKYKLKYEIKKRLKWLRSTPNPKLPKEEPKPITTSPKLHSIKLNGNQAA